MMMRLVFLAVGLLSLNPLNISAVGDIPYKLDVVIHKFLSLSDQPQKTPWSDQGDAQFRLQFTNLQLSEPALVVNILCEPPYGREEDTSFIAHIKGQLRLVSPKNSSLFLPFDVDHTFHYKEATGDIPIMEVAEILKQGWYDPFEDQVNMQLYIESLTHKE